jgi:hypothetical protein
MTMTSSLRISWGRDFAKALRISGEARTFQVSNVHYGAVTIHTVLSSPTNEHLTQTTSFLSLLPSLNEKWRAGDMRGELTTFSHSIKNSNAQWSHSQTCRQLPNAHKKRVVRDFFSTRLVIDCTSIDEVLEASECSNIGVLKLDQELNFILLSLLRKLVAIIRRLSTKKILLDAKRDLFGSYEDDDEDRMGITIDELMIEDQIIYETYCHEIPMEAWPASAVRSTPS